MAHATTPSPAKQGRSARFIPNPDGQGDQVAITQKGTTTNYWLDALPHDFGEAAFRLEKVATGKGDNPAYDVLLDKNMSTCTCPDFTYRGWKKGECKHILACHVLKQHGRI